MSSNSPNKPPNLLSYWQGLLLAIVPGIVVIALYMFACVPLTLQHIADSHANDLALAKAAAIDNSLQVLTDQLEGLGRQQVLKAALDSGDWQALNAVASEWTLLFSNVERLSLLPLGQMGVAGLGEHKAKLRNNIEKDLVSRAVGNDVVMIDAYQLGGRYVLSLAKSVSIGERKVGVVLLTLKSDWLAVQLERLASNEASNVIGFTSIMYVVPRAQPAVIVSDISRLSSADMLAKHQVALGSNANIKVEFAVVELPDLLAIATPIVIAAVGLAIFLAVVALQLLLKAAYKKLANDALNFKHFMAESFEGQVDQPAMSLPVFSHLSEKFTELLASHRADNTVRQAVKQQVLETESDVSESWNNPNIGKIDVKHGMSTSAPAEFAVTASAVAQSHIFRAYDIRGIADQELTDEVVEVIGRAIGSAAIDENCGSFVVARDGRLSSERIQAALVDGLLATGCDVIDIGMVATPVLYFAVETLDAQSGVMITGSHNGPEYNGMKIVLNGQALADESIKSLYRRIEQVKFHQGEGARSQQDMVDRYIDHIAADVVFASPLKVVLDCCNGAASEIAPMLYASLGCEVVPLFAEVDGRFPNHLPDPGVAQNLQALIDEVASQQADLGLAFDGDADRVVAVTAGGNIIYADELMMLFAKDVLTRNPGSDVVYDIKCSRNLGRVIAESGGRPIMWQSGHSRIKRKMRETGALLGGEFSGHFFFKERWFGFDDGMYSGARLIEYLTLEGLTLADAIAQLPTSVSSPEIDIPVDESHKFDVIQALMLAEFGDGEKTDLDGLRVDYTSGWGLVRASNTAPKLTARFEADTQEDLQRIKQQFAAALARVDASLILN